jgi:hypothetical protein
MARNITYAQFEDVPEEGWVGCPYIRVCPYMSEKDRESVEAGDIILKPVASYITGADTSAGNLLRGCKYDPSPEDCSYPELLMLQKLNELRINKLAVNVSDISNAVRRLERFDKSEEISEALTDLVDKLQAVGRILSGEDTK